MNKEKGRYNLESEQFKEREEFFIKTLNLNPRNYFTVLDGDVVSFEGGRFYKDVLYKTLGDYLKADKSLFSADFDLEKYISGIPDNDTDRIPVIVFDRNKVNEIYTARGESIADWMQENLKTFSDKVIAMKDNPERKAMAGIMTGSSVISISGICVDAFIGTYGVHGAMAPVLMEGEVSAAEVMADVLAALGINPVVVAVVAAAVAIGVAILMVAMLERKLILLLVNDTNLDIAVEDIYMRHGSMTARIEDDVYKNILPSKKRENEVYASFFVIEKNFGFYGTECTARLKVPETHDSFYLLAANPLSEKSRINLELKNDIHTFDGKRYSSAELHDELYDSGGREFQMEHPLFNINGYLNDVHGENAYATVCFKQEINDYADFTTPQAVYYGSLHCVGSDGFEYCESRQCYEIKPGGFCCFMANQLLEKVYLAELMTDQDTEADAVYYFEDRTDFKITKSDDFLVYTFPCKCNENKLSGSKNAEDSARKILELRNPSDKSSIYIRSVEVNYMQTELNNCNWMSEIPNETSLEDINIPGTHDSAAINRFSHTLYACHYLDITRQLKNGIRLLDIRLKVKNGSDGITFMTCHGNIGPNEYQTFQSVLDECGEFLKEHKNETILMSLKIDDYSIDESRRQEAYDLLEKLLNHYPVREYNNKLGTMGMSRGKIVLFNRINSETRFGYPISWENNTTGSYAADDENREFPVYVQDHWDMRNPITARIDKWNDVRAAMEKKKAGDSTVFLNYTSGCILFLRGVYIGRRMLQFFGAKKEQRLAHFGWLLMDYENSAYPTDFYGMMDLTSVIIASNFEYSGCSHAFKVIRDDL